MYRLVLSCLFIGMLAHAHCQSVTLVDAGTGTALHGAELSSGSGQSVITDSRGVADISAFGKATTIIVTREGYLSLTINMAEVKAADFVIRLSRSPLILDEAVVSSYTEEVVRKTSIHIEQLQLEQIEQQGTFSLTDALARVPGVTQLSTGPGISKPVIRGLYGNRILVLFSGLRFDNQQWQDEHGLGLADIGIERMEIIKGPLSLLYGTEAVGGVINIIEEAPVEKGTNEIDVKLTGHSNTGGGTLEAGLKGHQGNKWYRLRAAVTNHADYSDGNNERVLNSRFNGYYLKGSLGFLKNRWRSENHYSASYNHFGFIFNDLTHFMEPDDRWSRQMTGPHHIVLLNVLSSVNRFQLPNSVLKLNVGVQSNYRAEDEGGDELSLQMHLLTTQYSLKWQKRLSPNWSLVLANNSSLEFNKNFGRRKLVPDARVAESAFSVYLKQELNKLVLEYGLGAGVRYINALPTRGINSDEKEMDPFKQTRPFANGMLGASYLPGEHWNLKANIATGVRAPNLSELSSNGLHEGIYTYEIGDPDMRNEQNINADLGLYYLGERFEFGASAYYNHFMGYIYLQPTEEEWFGFPVYRFTQGDANIYGGEISAAYKPRFVEGLKVSASYAELTGQLVNGEYLPYMPAQKLKPEVRYDGSRENGSSFYGFVNTELVLDKNEVNSEESATMGYTLLNAGAGISFSTARARYRLNLSASNLLNEAYYDHLSRLKNFGFLNMGRNVTLTLKINFKNQ